jgi:hypothetical protein
VKVQTLKVLRRPTGPWTPTEDAALFDAMAPYRIAARTPDWLAISKLVPGRTPGGCEARSRHLLNPAPPRPPPAPKPQTVPKLEPADRPAAFERLCLCCRRPFQCVDRRNNWMCQGCRNPYRSGH